MDKKNMTKQLEHTVLQHIPLRNSVSELQKRLAELYDLALKYNFKDTATAISMAEDTLRKERESND
tara:strand:+ start:439 stop:636 length:198 start_codon:yes stop_codon:yes gene_type:complete